ncbi:MAG TPA: hypothetical protein GX005_05080 [Bacteroidales bacterium]|nr:hypothetical protein [Bacteroidales bacterium]
MTLKEAIEKHNGLSFVFNELNISSPIGRKTILETNFSKDKDYLSSQYSIIESCQTYISEEINLKALKKVRGVLAHINDISGTVKQLEQNLILDDISLFQIKQFSIFCYKISSYIFDIDNYLEDNLKGKLNLPDLNKVIKILDPEGLMLSQFYIYNAYSKELAKKRQEWEIAKKQEDETKVNNIYLEIEDLENEIRERLSKELKVYFHDFIEAIRLVGKIDKSFALAEYFLDNNFTKPIFSTTNQINYKELSYPPLVSKLKELNKTYQPIDITLTHKPCLVTGANMAGKTILLKSLYLSQLLLQFGFFVPAKESEIVLVEDILCSIGDHQDEEAGLSSYASEILLLDNIIKKVKQGNQYLVLVDELARTTNPKEGVALVDSFLNILSQHNSFSVTTTHYSGITTQANRLRVKGFIPNDRQKEISINEISNQIDYSLIEDHEMIIPNEALYLADLLKVDKEFIEGARKLIKK